MDLENFWTPLICDFDYEIFTYEYPYPIRRRSNKKIVSEYKRPDDYIALNLNGKLYLKHRIVAEQFITNENPFLFNQVDHINHKRDDFHISNLRWSSPSINSLNRTKNYRHRYKFISYDEKPKDCFEITNYGNHFFKGYYFSPKEDKFYHDIGVNLRILAFNIRENLSSPFVYMNDVDGKQIRVLLDRFKRMEGLII